jgi:hypothetical protein
VRVVYVTNGFPWPLTSGYLRHYFLIRELAAASHEVALFSLVGRDVSAEDRAALEAWTPARGCDGAWPPSPPP